MKPAKRIIKLPLFPIEYFLFVGEDIKDAHKKLTEEFLGIEERKDFGNAVAETEVIKNKEGKVFFIVKIQEDSSIEVVVHEALQLTHLILKSLKMEVNAKNDELECYIQADIIKNILKTISITKYNCFLNC